MPRNPTILLVDNDPLFRADLEFLLEDAGCRVICSCHGNEAGRAIREEVYDLLVIDVLLPGRQTIDALVERRAEGAPVVAFSKSQRPLPAYYDGLIRRLGIRAVLTTPIDREQLEGALRIARAGLPAALPPVLAPFYSLPA